MLVKGIMDVVNRPFELRPTNGYPAWVLVVSSQNCMSETHCDAAMAALKTRMQSIGHPLANSGDIYNIDEYDTSCIIGMVKVDRCTNRPPPSVWYNEGSIAWVVSEAWEFDTPIKQTADDKMHTQVLLEYRPQYKEAIRIQIENLEPGPI
jgi:hypothetical protein